MPHDWFEARKEVLPALDVIRVEIVRGNILNPARLTQERVLDLLASEKGLTNVHQLKEAQEPFGDEELYSAFRAKYGSITLLDIDPQSWGLKEDGSTYRFFYRSRTRLIDLNASKIAWQDQCEYVDEESNFLEDLAKEAAAGLKQKVEKAAGVCAQHFICHLSGKQC